MPKLFYITTEWSEQSWFNTGGTRAKKYLQAPDGKFYYFKRSQFKSATETKPGKDFKYEFWNEIIAYEVGTLLGFNILRYDVAVDGEIMGCISESMIDSENEELIEGVQFLQAYTSEYDPAIKEHQTRYTFDLIENALEAAKIKEFISNILELIVFDALIGNGDRHQENWAVIVHYRKEKTLNIPTLYYAIDKEFSPIYDNGSSLGRELLEERVGSYLSVEKELKGYIDKGLSECS